MIFYSYFLSFFIFLAQILANSRKPDSEIFQVKILSENPEIYLVENFFPIEYCDHIRDKALPYLKRSSVVDNSGRSSGIIHEGRTSSSMHFPPYMRDPILDALEKKIARLTKTDKKNGEWIQVMRYKIKEEYLPHYDFFDSQTEGGRRTLLRGGQRIATCILYLQEPNKGGETIFPFMLLSVPPKKGNLLLFYNCTPDDQVDFLTFHGSAPVEEGEKWIATRWIRQQEFH